MEAQLNRGRMISDITRGSVRYVLSEAILTGNKYGFEYNYFHVYTITAIYSSGQIASWVYDTEKLARDIYNTLTE